MSSKLNKFSKFRLVKLHPRVNKSQLNGTKKISKHASYSNSSDKTVIRKKSCNNVSPVTVQGVKTSEFHATAMIARFTDEKRKFGCIDILLCNIYGREFIRGLLLYLEVIKKGIIVVILATKTCNMERSVSLRFSTDRWRLLLSKCKQTNLSSKYESNGTASTLINAESRYKQIADVIVYLNHQEEISYYVFHFRDPKCLHGVLLKVNRFDCTQECCKRTNTVFRTFKPFRESQMIKRNDKQYLGRKFKDSCNRNLIFIRINITTNKVVNRYIGPFRVVNIVGSKVFCHSLATRIKKQVHIDRCRLYR